MKDSDTLYRVGDQTYTYDELHEETLAEVADLPPETWRYGFFDFDDYLTESVLVGTIEIFDEEDEGGDE